MMHAKDILLPMLCHHKSKPEATAIEAIDYAVKVFARGLQDSRDAVVVLLCGTVALTHGFFERR